jgi:hypothetical protein
MAQVLPTFYESFARGQRDALDFQNTIEEEKRRKAAELRTQEMFPLELEGKRGYNDLQTQYIRRQRQQGDYTEAVQPYQIRRDISDAEAQVLGFKNRADFERAVAASAAGASAEAPPEMRPAVMRDSLIPSVERGTWAGNYFRPTAAPNIPSAETTPTTDLPSYLNSGYIPPNQYDFFRSPGVGGAGVGMPGQVSGEQTGAQVSARENASPQIRYDLSGVGPSYAVGRPQSLEEQRALQQMIGAVDLYNTRTVPEPARLFNIDELARRSGLTPEQVQYVFETDQMYNAPAGLGMATLFGESSFNPNAVSSKDAQGIAQITGATAALLNKKYGTNLNPMIPAEAIQLHRLKMMDIQNNIDPNNPRNEELMRLYFAGPDRKKWGKETEAYPGYIKDRYQQLHKFAMGAQ